MSRPQARSAARTALGATGSRKTATEASVVPQRPKYGAVRTEVNGIVFASKREAKRYQLLTILERQGLIRDLRRQVPYPLHAEGGGLVGRYDADFVYEELVDGEWEMVVEDAKGFPVPLYIWKKRHLLAEYGIEIRET